LLIVIPSIRGMCQLHYTSQHLTHTSNPFQQTNTLVKIFIKQIDQ